MPKEYVIARLEVKGQRFEVLVNPELALKVKEGKSVNVDDLLVGDIVYKDSRKGLKASPEALKQVFGTDDIRKVALEIVKKGEIQLTAEQRRKMIEAKRKQIIAFIARNTVDPKTGKPHPPSRIEIAMQQARVGVDPFKDVESQALQIIKAISRYLPLKIAKALVQIKVPAKYAGRAYGALAGMGEVKRADWKPDGSLVMELEIPAGMQQDLIDKVNNLTRGEGEVKVLYVR